jgi:hypothetical protein
VGNTIALRRLPILPFRQVFVDLQRKTGEIIATIEKDRPLRTKLSS